MLLDLLPQHLNLSFFVAVPVRVENPTILQSDCSLDLPLAEHRIGQLKLLILRHVVLHDKLEEGRSTLSLLGLELDKVVGQHLKVGPLLIIDPLLLLPLQVLRNRVELLLAELEPGFGAAITRPQREFESDRVR